MRVRHPLSSALCSVALSTAPLAAQRPPAPPPTERPATLLDRRPALGGYGSLDMRLTQVRGASEALAGVEFALLLDHRLSIGLAGVGLSTDEPASGVAAPSSLRLGYGGIRLGYRFAPTAVVHPVVDLLLGGGGVRQGAPGRAGGAAGADGGRETSTFFVAEPSIGAEVNLARVVRLVVGASYRHVGGLDDATLRDTDLRGASLHVALRAGRF